MQKLSGVELKKYKYNKKYMKYRVYNNKLDLKNSAV